MVTQARYSSDPTKNAILRAALFEAWKFRCYFCDNRFDVAVIEIDHIIPSSYRHNTSRLDEVLRDCLSPQEVELGFDIDAPHNLAPICRKCNKDKSNDTFEAVPVFTRRLRKARNLESRVEKLVSAFGDRTKLAQALLDVAALAELDDPKAEETLMEFGPLMVNRLRVVAPDVLEAPSDYPFDHANGDEMHHIIVTLNEAGRRARVILEDVYSCDFDESIFYPVGAVMGAINAQLVSSMESYLASGGEWYPDVGEPRGRIVVEVEELVYQPPKGFEIGGKFEADGSSLASIHANNDSGTAEVQVDATATGAFSLYFEPHDEDVEADSVELTIADASAWCEDYAWKTESDFRDDWLDEPDDPDA
ncbi:HNH endonuclease [Mycobacteroides abscessus]|uniref:HNH endonuclease n=1 Tax=Mycobacteroides abscessus TaxID=36809 RepID=UPI0013F4D589|nr:HNH endonuclease signature motif containing protein [Mycobacteroides abscessus]